jgi:two-component system, LytTR family, response regulator
MRKAGRRMRVAVATADAKSLANASSLVESFPELELVARCPNAASASALLAREQLDILIVGIELTSLASSPSADGIELPDTCAVIALSNDDRECVDAIAAGAVDFVVRPLQLPRLELALERAKDHSTQLAPTVPRSVGAQPQAHDLKHILVKRNHEFIFLPTAEVERIESERNYVRVYSRGQSYLLRGRISDAETALDPLTFARVHRSTIVNVKYIERMQRGYNGDFVLRLRSGTQVRLTRSHSHAFFERFILSTSA